MLPHIIAVLFCVWFESSMAMGMKAKSLQRPFHYAVMCEESRVTLLPSELEMHRIEMRNERKLLPALEKLQVLGS